MTTKKQLRSTITNLRADINEYVSLAFNNGLTWKDIAAARQKSIEDLNAKVKDLEELAYPDKAYGMTGIQGLLVRSMDQALWGVDYRATWKSKYEYLSSQHAKQQETTRHYRLLLKHLADTYGIEWLEAEIVDMDDKVSESADADSRYSRYPMIIKPCDEDEDDE